MKTAKEMFEELGFEKLSYEFSFTNENEDYVEFDLKRKTYMCICHFNYEHPTAFNISSELHQAITQQMKELGWIK